MLQVLADAFKEFVVDVFLSRESFFMSCYSIGKNELAHPI